MTLYDREDPSQNEVLTARVVGDDLIRRNLIQTFGPDTVAEAVNRGFKPIAAKA